MGNSKLNKSEYLEALDYFQRSIEINEQVGYKKGSTVSLSNIGNINYYQGNYPEALNIQAQCLDFFQKKWR
ncbi:MAG: tetratricopeptide (TPR) repeat protein [bacterium]|jgi:tetratricopeptide (TPR) repeat protein